MPQTKQEIELNLFVGYTLNLKEVFFFRDRGIRSNTVNSLLLLLFLNLQEIPYISF